MIKDEQMVFRVPSDLKAEFQQAANAIERPASQVLREFMRTFISRVNQEQPRGTDSTTIQRQDAINFGRASVALEGMTVSPEAEALQQRFVGGEISIEECIAAIKLGHQVASRD
ncbi:antitoxin VbhA family protein [Massilia putida]|uniref:antitoxin VbhA family protein n=1 Tax=Massilia putida TaxID=1141883 RepID=UPI0009F99721|nr:antitoxin VbhA family protein [Massilia putida]